MAGLVPAIHAVAIYTASLPVDGLSEPLRHRPAWVAGTSPAMTVERGESGRDRSNAYGVAATAWHRNGRTVAFHRANPLLADGEVLLGVTGTEAAFRKSDRP